MKGLILKVFAYIFLHFGGIVAYRVGNNPHHRLETLDPNGKYQLEWLVDLDRKRVTFNVTVETGGYVGFGLSSFGKMSGADIVIGGVRSDGSSYFSDRHAVGHHVPQIDPSQDWDLHLAKENGSHTFLSFSRAFDTCDPQDYPITEDKIAIIWSYGERDTIRYHHRNRGQYNIYLINPDYAPHVTYDSITDEITIHDESHSETKVWTMKTKLELPPVETTYWCTIHKAPRLSRKHHAIGYDVRLPTPESVRHNHHIMIHRCHPPPGISAKRMFDQWTRQRGQRCLMAKAPTGPMPTEYCTEFAQSWANGGRAFFQPDDLGVPFGEAPDEYYMVQQHLDNPGLVTPMIEVKLDIYYTPVLRPLEGGLLILRHESPGLPPSILIPPSTIDHKTYGICGAGCSRKMFPPEGITIYGVLLHSHNAGRRMKIQHFRNNRELPWIASDDTYSFNYQQYRVLNRHVKVLPGDQLIVECVYDNTQTNGTIVGGFSSQQEMCAHPIFYHSKLLDYQQCSSEVHSDEYRQHFLGVTNVTFSDPRVEFIVDEPHPLAGLTISEVSDNHVNWDLDLRDELERFHLFHPHVGRCPQEIYARHDVDNYDELSTRRSENSEDPGQLVSYPVEAIPYRPPETCSFPKK